VREPHHLKWIPCRRRQAPAIRNSRRRPSRGRSSAACRTGPILSSRADPPASAGFSSQACTPRRSPSNGHPWRPKPPDPQTVGLGRQPKVRPCPIMGSA
jgi:hypothetical protein